ncbi:aldehyde dehydrogenase (NADP(+)) [Hufsiella ginkgonis]|uniref:Aldehyde dehydrogenase family protein n=1 Tax=Hufsiella ginkgonis TaxID=2695274 RepID=A0A7K1Y1W1_9SPHI|nr:aldehyde dehydrogenase (NADP(+)) [Hufsiella ginkgonis]MXV17009.1 aldehyde dehydrogenase family protein [Hufsiella ginkgonis]
MHQETSAEALEVILHKAKTAATELKKMSARQRGSFMRTIGKEIELLGDKLIHTAMAESHLPEARLTGERARTIFQWQSYANAAELGTCLDLRIDTANPSRTPPKPDLRKMQVPIGPVAVFGASNFPFAFSTAGGDTACAVAAGCPVIVKAHPAHPKTAALMEQAILRAVEKCRFPEGTFAQIWDPGIEVAQALVSHPVIKAVAFTGSFTGGKALFDLANRRKDPIPVFAEMGSVNPVFILPGKLGADPAALAQQFAASVTLGVGQFCTNPGLAIGIEGPDLDQFIAALTQQVKAVAPANMLHAGIASNYHARRSQALQQPGVAAPGISDITPAEGQGLATVAVTDAATFLSNPVLHEEVFGPFSLVVKCAGAAEMLEIAGALQGQLTATLLATAGDLASNEELIHHVQDFCGRIIVNNFPTGVDVSLAMHHGGPFPASTDSRFTSVGADGIRRFSRPLCFQNWPDEFLPDELKNENPLDLWRVINNETTLEPVKS